MTTEPVTLYKLMVIFMLKQISFRITNSQISDFFLSKNYTNYFTMQTVLSELVEAKLISVETLHDTSKYELTKDGAETLEFFGNQIPAAIKDDIKEYLKENNFRMKSELSINASYHMADNQEYIVSCSIDEGKSSLLSLDISVPDEAYAKHMCSKWRSNNQEIFQFIMKSLMT